MELEKELYKERLIDSTLDDYLKVCKAVLIRGPKWCGKTWTALKHSKSGISMMDVQNRKVARIDPSLTLRGENPRLIDEWQEVPSLWDTIRTSCDSTNEKGLYILTGSTTSVRSSDDDDDAPRHTGTGRIVTLTMSTMTLWEAGFSQDLISLHDMKTGKNISSPAEETPLMKIAELIVRGGFPDNIEVPAHIAGILPKHYIEAVAYKDMNQVGDRRRDPRKMEMLIRSLARNEATLVNTKSLLRDIRDDADTEDESARIKSRNTLEDYLGVLESLCLIWHQEMFDCNYRSRSRVGGKSKQHLADPSLAAAALSLTPERMINDLNTMGFLFEGMVERDLRAYMSAMQGNLYHFRDSVSQDEVDAIVEFSDGEYGAIEIKLGADQIDKAKESLVRFRDNIRRKPVFMCVIVGSFPAVTMDPETGIYIVPFTALGLHRELE